MKRIYVDECYWEAFNKEKRQYDEVAYTPKVCIWKADNKKEAYRAIKRELNYPYEYEENGIDGFRTIEAVYIGESKPIITKYAKRRISRQIVNALWNEG